MSRETLLDFFHDLHSVNQDFFVYDNGYRARAFTYREVADGAELFARQLAAAKIQKDDKVILWGENRPEWVIAFWGCLLNGVVVVPIDYRASMDFLLKVRDIVQARLVLVGEDVSQAAALGDTLLWHLADVGRAKPALCQDVEKTFADWDGASKVSITRDDVAEIIFTSGATADPKGVVITHRNLLANLVPIESEMAKYLRYARPFKPIRFLNLLPLSHLFGQAMGVFIPAMLPGTVVFTRGHNPAEMLRQVRTRHISVIVSVPKMLDLLRQHVAQLYPASREIPARKRHVAWRWWKHRKIHRLFGFKFWSFVVGAAPLDPDLEEFWSNLGYLVVQGYGLTETAPIVSLNHPFGAKKGSVGKPMPGVEVKIAADGEILVRGENVTRGYYHAETATREAFEEGWLHTGDIGGFDEDGRLHIQGRKKEMIVTPEGLNVFPEDVERVLNAVNGVRESAVVGISSGGEERVHAALVLETAGPQGVPLLHPAEVIRIANARLADHQRIRGVTIWPGDKLPRTEGTQKLKRREIKAWIEKGGAPRATTPGDDPLRSLLSKFAGDRTLAPQTTLEELGLSSLERVELLLALEDRFQITLDELEFAEVKDLAALQGLIERGVRDLPSRGGETAEVAHEELVEFPSWSRRWSVRLLRHIGLAALILPLTRLFAWIRVEGREHLNELKGPVLFAANHQSHMDAPAIFAALPRRWRYRLAPAMSKEFFKAHFYPQQSSRWKWFTSSLQYGLSVLCFNAFPLPQREAGVRQTLRYVGELAGAGYSILIFPEGKRTDRGEINRFMPGVGMMSARLEVPVVPVRLEGLDRVLHHTWRMARPGRVRVAFGKPIRLEGEDYSALAKRVEEAVRTL